MDKTFPSTTPTTVHDHEFSSTFRLLDVIDRHFSHKHRFLHKYIPRFDLEELKNSYVLFGELPGAEQKDLTITATDNHTLEISGRTERFTAEDVLPIEGENGNEISPQNDAAGPSTAVSAPDGNTKTTETLALKPRCLISERLVGEFHRSFSFPKPIESSGVTASMKDGVLKVVVPKGPAPKERDIPVKYMGIVYT